MLPLLRLLTLNGWPGRLESEVARAEKLTAHNTALKDLVEKQAKVYPLHFVVLPLAFAEV
jgi:hypothetical protein